MSRRESRCRHRPAFALATLAAVLTTALALAGCSAGTVTQTDTVVSQAPGGTGQTGQLLARNVTLDAGPAQVVTPGGQIALRGTLVNEGTATDRLISVTTPYAQQVSVEGQTIIPGANAVRLAGLDEGAVGPVRPDIRQAASMRLVLRGVTQVMRPGPTYTVTFTFQNAGTMTVPVTMVEPISSSG